MYVRKYVCALCGYVYDEAKGIPEQGIAPGTKWEDLPDDWSCPDCGATKDEFVLQGDSGGTREPVPADEEQLPALELSANLNELSPLEISAICTNLARGCEKQYKPEEAALFSELGEYFKSISPPAEAPSFERLSAMIQKDLEENLQYAKAASADAEDRGAMRALVWSEKVTRVQKSILSRYEKEGDALLENKGVHVCTICGFIYIGDTLPELCPICKVPNWKFEEIEGGYADVR